MLELASQRSFRECAQHHLSAPGIPGNVEGAHPGSPRQRTVGTLAGKRYRADLRRPGFGRRLTVRTRPPHVVAPPPSRAPQHTPAPGTWTRGPWQAG